METKLILIDPTIDDGVYVCDDCARKTLYEGLTTVIETTEANPMCINCHDLLWPGMPN